MGTSHRRLLAAAVCPWLLSIAACPRDRLELVPVSRLAQTPPAIRAACALAEQRCSRCHDLERIQLAHPALVDWPVYVDRMRHLPGSGITGDEASIIVRCLTWVESMKHESELYSHGR